ncbi:MAG: HEAT repeat domain-containing protein [Gemmatimonadaceae bacterium]
MLKSIVVIALIGALPLSAQVKPARPAPKPPVSPVIPKAPPGWADERSLFEERWKESALRADFDYAFKLDAMHPLMDNLFLQDALRPGFDHAFELGAMRPPFDRAFELDALRAPLEHDFALDKLHGELDAIGSNGSGGLWGPPDADTRLFDHKWNDHEFDFAPRLAGKWDGLAGKDWRLPEASHPEDPADSLYRQARELLNRGEWRRAVTTFKDITAKFPNSSYVPDALYWQAFALYRIGSGGELREALQLLEAQRTRYPNARTQSDASALRTRIRGALAARGDASAAEQIARTASDSTQRCDQEDIAVRAEALNALTQSDPDGAAPVLQRVLARRDECSVMLRRNAVFILGSKRRDASATATLIRVAKTDPSVEVRGAAIEWLARLPGEEALTTLEELSRNSDDERIQRTAVRALVRHSSDKARQLVRSIVERSETPERLRLEALGAFEKERVNADDVAWLRTFYGRTDNQRIKQRVLSTLGRVGGPDVDQWFLTMVRNTDEASEVRITALRRVGKSLAISDLSKLYDTSAERPIREELIGIFANRPDNEATDKLIDIVKTGTDPNLRRMAISALSQKKDARTMKFLLELVEK